MSDSGALCYPFPPSRFPPDQSNTAGEQRMPESSYLFSHHGRPLAPQTQGPIVPAQPRRSSNPSTRRARVTRRGHSRDTAQLLRTTHNASFSFTYDAVVVAVVHILVGGMITRHRRDAVFAGLSAGDSPVAVAVVLLKCIAALRRRQRAPRCAVACDTPSASPIARTVMPDSANSSAR